MAAFDYITAVYDRLWALAEAHAPFAALVGEGNRIKLSGAKALPYKPTAKQAADAPEVILRVKDGVDSLEPPEAETFGDCGGSYSEIVQAYEFTVTHRDFRVQVNSPVELELMTAIRKGLPKLGLAYVDRVDALRVTRTEQTTEEAAGRFRPITRILITVRLRFQKSELIV